MKPEQKTLEIWHTKGLIEAGIDEAGRGPLLGDLYVGSVIWSHDPDDYDSKSPLMSQIKDSKKLSPQKREILAEFIKENCLAYSVISMSIQEIEKYNILGATMKGMHKAIRGLNIIPQQLLIDGDKFKPYIDYKYGVISHHTIPKGDNKYISIAAASILAKTEHDKHIKQLIFENPYLEKYGLETGNGYGTKKHREAIGKYGITKFHRKKFCQKWIHTTEEQDNESSESIASPSKN